MSDEEMTDEQVDAMVGESAAIAADAESNFKEIEEPVQEQVDAAITKGVMVATVAVEWEGEKRMALLFSFATHDGALLPPIVYVGDELDDVAALVKNAAEHAKTVNLEEIEVKAGG